MKPLEKLYSDLTKASKQAGADWHACGELFVTAVKTYDRELEAFANDLMSNGERYFNDRTAPEVYAQFFFNLYCFVTGQFEADCDFSDEQWDDLYASVTAAEDTLPIELLQGYLSLLLERGIF